MNHRTHSGSSPTVITNPNAFDSSNSTKTNSISQSTATPFTSDNKRNHHNYLRSNVPKSAISSDRSSVNTITSHPTVVLDFDALESIPIDGVTADDTTKTTINNVISQFTHATGQHNNDTNNSAHISAVFKKLTTYFSTSSHKTLTNLKFNNHKTRKLNHLTNRQSQLGDVKQFSCNTINSRDNCAVFENCNAISTTVSSNESECSSDDTSPLPSDNQLNFVNQAQHTKSKPTINLHHHSSDRINAKAMCRADDSYALDGRTTTIATTTMPSNPQSTNKRTKDLKVIEATGETFSLPRVSLRQSSASPTASSANHRKNTINSSKRSSLIDTSSLDRRRSFGEREQVPSSHYSTEKSGSSGYYSSNVYSTSSVEDHIYSEPVIGGIVDQNRRNRKFDQKLDQQIGLANLEKSIKTLEKHLKSLNKSKDHVKQQQQQQQQQPACDKTQEAIIESNVSADEHSKRLPTIVEGMDNNAMAMVPYRRSDASHRRPSDWTADTTDDSLMDLDLDTFLLIDEKARDKKKVTNFNQIRSDGIENPTFQSDNEHERDDSEPDDDDDVERHEHTDNDADKNQHKSSGGRNSDENNYKCTKYINSCPDDAYNVDEIIDYKYEQSHYPFANKLLPFYMKNIEDQLNQQNTKDILEEIRDKLAVLLKPTIETEHESSTESDGIISSKSNTKTTNDSLMHNIVALKHDVDNYLVMLNQQNELEIRAFCSGLSKNYKLLTMQQALDNRTRRLKVSTSDIGSELYSNSNSSSSHHHQSLVRRKRRMKNQMKRSQNNKTQLRTWKNQTKKLLNQHENESIRCSSSSDSNFQLQRRHSDSICSSWDDAPQILTTSSSGRGSSSSANSDNSIGHDAIVPIEVQTLLTTSNRDSSHLLAPASNDAASANSSIDLTISAATAVANPTCNGHIESNLAMQQPSLISVDNAKDATTDEKDIMLEWHRNKPSIWQQYYGSKRLKYSSMVKKIKGKFDVNPAMALSYLFDLNSSIIHQLGFKVKKVSKPMQRTKKKMDRKTSQPTQFYSNAPTLVLGLNACEKKSYVFLRKEVPVRLANIMKEIALLPDSLSRTQSVNLVSSWYARSFEEILRYEQMEPTTSNMENFCRDLVKIRDRHSDVVQTMAQGVIEMKEQRGGTVEPSMELSIQYFLDRLYMSRISIRMLINQHTLLFGEIPQQGRHIGCIDPLCDPGSVVLDAYENARYLCDQYYLASPELKLTQHNGVEQGAPIRIVYVPSHLYHMLFELFKNSMRAVMEYHGDDCINIPPIEVTIVNGREDISVKLSDRGGGIPRSQVDQLFKYMYSTAPKPSPSHLHTVPLAGYGYGLPISRLYARYFQGDLTLYSCEGYGTDALIYMKAFSDEANELLPIFNKTSSRFYKATVPTGDWSNQSSNMNIRQINASSPSKRSSPTSIAATTSRLTTTSNDNDQFTVKKQSS